MPRPLLLTLLALAGCAPAQPSTPQSGAAPQAEVAPQAAAPLVPDAAPPPAPAPSPRAAAAIAHARSYLGMAYVWAGRDTKEQPGLDCLGLLYRAWGPVTGTPWRKYPVNPSKIVASGLLGAPVPGLAGALRAEIDRGLLHPGDVLYLLLGEYEIPDDPLLVHDGVRYWPWHTGLFVGEGKGTVIHASPSAGVAEQPLDELAWDALYVTRP